MKHYKENWLGEEIVIDNKLDPVCKVYHGETLIGKCKSVTTLQNIQTQIKAKYISEVVKQNKDWTPYYIEFEGEKIEIDPISESVKLARLYDQFSKAVGKYYSISANYITINMEQIKKAAYDSMVWSNSNTTSTNLTVEYNSSVKPKIRRSATILSTNARD